MFAGVNIAGAGQRLLHERIPMRFFGVAVVAHVLAWLALVGVAPAAPGFGGGIGPEIAAVHLLTIGVLVPTAMGASLQMLPVALSCPAPPEAACEAVFWPFVAGAVVLIAGFAVPAPTLMVLGAVLAAIGIGIYAVLIGRTLVGHRGHKLVALHIWTAMVSLAMAALLAIALALDIDRGFLPDHDRAAIAHALLAGYGFMGFLALGFSHILIPMFVTAQAPQSRTSEIAFWSVAAALVVSVLGVLFGSTPLVVASGASAGALGALFFAWFALMVATRAKTHIKNRAIQQGSQTS